MGLVQSEGERTSAIEEKVREKWEGKEVRKRNADGRSLIDLHIKDSRPAPDADDRASMPSPENIGKIVSGGGSDASLTAWGRCGNPSGSWPLTTFVEETDDYIVMCCDAGCTVTLIKKPPAKKRPKRSILIVNGEMVDSSDVKVPLDVPVDF